MADYEDPMCVELRQQRDEYRERCYDVVRWVLDTLSHTEDEEIKETLKEVIRYAEGRPS